MDSEGLKPLNFDDRHDHVLLGRMGVDPEFDHSVPNAIMASRPREIFWLLAIERMVDMASRNSSPAAQDRLGPEEMTGPILLKRTLDRYRALDESGVRMQASAILESLDDEQRKSVQYGPVTLLHRRRWYALDWSNMIHKALRNRMRDMRYILTPDEARHLFPEAEIVTYWSHSW